MTFWVAGAIVGSAVIGAVGSHSAASTQAQGQQQAAQTQQGMFNTINKQEQPFIQGGYSALNDLLYGINGGGSSPSATPQKTAGPAARPIGGRRGQVLENATGVPTPNAVAPAGGPNASGITPGQFTHQFTAADLGTNLTPGYNFQLQQGEQAVRNAMTPTQGALSGATLKDLMSFNQNLASTSYQQAFNNWQTQNNTIFGRLSGIAGLGQNAATNVGTAGTSLGTGIAQAQAGAGASQAGGIVGATNALGSNAIPLGYLMRQGQTPTSTGGGDFGAALAAQNVAQYGYPGEAGT